MIQTENDVWLWLHKGRLKGNYLKILLLQLTKKMKIIPRWLDPLNHIFSLNKNRQKIKTSIDKIAEREQF